VSDYWWEILSRSFFRGPFQTPFGRKKGKEPPLEFKEIEKLEEFLEEHFFSFREQEDICACGSRAQQAVYDLLQENQFRLVRSNTHDVWRSTATGLTWTTPKTASDHRSWKNNFSDLKNTLAGRRGNMPLRQYLEPEEIISADEALRRDNKRRRPN